MGALAATLGAYWAQTVPNSALRPNQKPVPVKCKEEGRVGGKSQPIERSARRSHTACISTASAETLWRKRQEKTDGATFAVFVAAIDEVEGGLEIELNVRCRKRWSGSGKAVGSLVLYTPSNEIIFSDDLHCTVGGPGDGGYNQKNPKELVTLLGYSRDDLKGMKVVYVFDVQDKDFISSLSDAIDDVTLRLPEILAAGEAGLSIGSTKYFIDILGK